MMIMRQRSLEPVLCAASGRPAGGRWRRGGARVRSAAGCGRPAPRQPAPRGTPRATTAPPPRRRRRCRWTPAPAGWAPRQRSPRRRQPAGRRPDRSATGGRGRTGGRRRGRTAAPTDRRRRRRRRRPRRPTPASAPPASTEESGTSPPDWGCRRHRSLVDSQCDVRLKRI